MKNNWCKGPEKDFPTWAGVFFSVDVGCGRQAFLFSSVGCSFAQKAVFRATYGTSPGVKPLGSPGCHGESVVSSPVGRSALGGPAGGLCRDNAVVSYGLFSGGKDLGSSLPSATK